MQVKLIVGRFCFIFVSLFISLVCHAQVDGQNADLEDPSDTLDILTPKGAPAPQLTDAELLERISTLSSCVDVRINGVVKGYIKTYVQYKTEKAQNMLGKRLTYFPLFEEKLKQYGVPQDLKYLSVVESALNPKAVSRVGATGLWQFMPSTGGEYGLKTSSAVEDRSNPVKSTDAAARHLRDLYKQFDDWALALAAYNSGAGRVRAAIKRSGSRNFWKLQNFLPKETRNYVPAFIAATYICNYFWAHGLTANNPDMDEQLTDYINVYEGLSFKDISDATGVSVQVIEDLNPGFRRSYVPPTTDGHFVIVPARVMPAFVRYLNTVSSARSYKLENPENYTSPDVGDGRYWQSSVKVKETVKTDDFAARLGLCGEHLKSWNNLSGNYLIAGQTLKLYRPVFVQKHAAIRIEMPGSEKTRVQSGSGNSTPVGSASPGNKQPAFPAQEESPKIRQFMYHTVKRNESLEDIARLYSTSVESLKKRNNCEHVKFGTRLLIRQF